MAALAPWAASAAKAPSAGELMEFGVQMARRGLWSEALFRFQQADKLQPNDPETLNNLAVACEAVGKFEEALEYYQKALRASPNSRDLKKNYSRFVEFYQGFKPDGEEPAAEGSSGDESGETGRA
jgi:Flp pilus assembly protein TadD